jgi:hypothetical protein
VIQRDDFRRPAGQVPLNGPLGVDHSARLPRTIATGLAPADGSSKSRVVRSAGSTTARRSSTCPTRTPWPR